VADVSVVEIAEPPAERRARVAIVLKGYPRLSETFIAQEILALEQRGFAFDIWSLRRPTDRFRHPMHEAITARLFYLPEYLKDDLRRVLRGLVHAYRHLAWRPTLAQFMRDFARDPTASRLRRLGQAFVLAQELDPGIRHLHVHFLHTPASVTRYAALLTGRSFSFSAHAKDIWTTPDWERREKIAHADWGVTCTADGLQELQRVSGAWGGDVSLLYHGLDLGRFPSPPSPRPARDGSEATDPVRLISVGRAVEKKGFDVLLDALDLPQAALIGLSMGAGIATGYALDHPDRVTGLIAAGPGGIEARRRAQLLTWLVLRTPGILRLTSRYLARRPELIRRSLVGSLTAGESTRDLEQIVRLAVEEAMAKEAHGEPALDD